MSHELLPPKATAGARKPHRTQPKALPAAVTIEANPDAQQEPVEATADSEGLPESTRQLLEDMKRRN
jgi:hypothetical protein